MDIIVEHVRSFARRHTIPIRPLTLLVGENSSGKSTFLAIVSSALNASRFPTNPGLNEPPYNLGTFDTIATYKGGKYGRDKSFSIGFSTSRSEKAEHTSVVATYGSDLGKVTLTRLSIATQRATLDMTFSGRRLTGTISLQADGGNASSVQFGARLPVMGMSEGALWPNVLFYALGRRLPFAPAARAASRAATFKQVARLMERARPPYRSSYSYAPIRSKPRRTYDELSEEYSPEGDHIPTLLARLLREAQPSSDSARVRQALVRFGSESGLFRDVDVKKLGASPGDPFQLRVAVGGPPVNLADVGYGVSQALPIVVQSVLRTTSRVLLLQQPEVHLHPRAQAALGSFFVDLVVDHNRVMVVETHSDHLVDRVRQEVATGRVDKDKVLILFFHKPKLETTVYQLQLDKFGNVENAPAEYRSFFLEEELKLFSRTG